MLCCDLHRRLLVALGVLLLAGGCKQSGEGAPSGGVPSSEDPVPSPGEEARPGGAALSLEITEVFTGVDVRAGRRSFLAPTETTTVRARVRNGPSHEPRIRWQVRPVGSQTGEPRLVKVEGPELVFQPSSRLGQSGSRKPNPPLEYDVLAVLEVDGRTLEARLPVAGAVRQDEVDTLRQEYLDYATVFRPTLASVVPAQRASLNTGNYALVVEEQPGGLLSLFSEVNERFGALLENDVQVKRVGTRRLSPSTVVVSPGPAILQVGPLGDTDPQGDDRCGGPTILGRCAGPILAGPNGIAETRANNRVTRVSLESFVSSAYRNPQRNRAAGSKAVNSRHTRGRAIDIDPRAIPVAGKTSAHLMCLVEMAGDLVVGERNAFTERGATTFLDCDDPAADHVHIQR